MSTLAERVRRADQLVEQGRSMLREAIVDAAAEGMTQREIAAVVGRSQPEIARHLRVATRTFRTAPEIAQAMTAHLVHGDEAQALRVMLDGVNALPTLTARGDIRAFLTAPRSTGDARWDTLLATAVAYRSRKAGLQAPRWTWRPPLGQFWWPAGEEAARAQTMRRTPIDFKRLGIWFDERNFTSA